LHTEFEAVFHLSLGVVRCGGLEVQHVKTTRLKLSPTSQLNTNLETAKFLQHINPDVKVSPNFGWFFNTCTKKIEVRSKP
jgi:hypothetical protein